MTTVEGEISGDPAESFRKNFVSAEEKIDLIRREIADKIDQGEEPTLGFFELTQAIHTAILNLVEMRATSAVMMEISVRTSIIKGEIQ